ncbi:MAG: MarR family transcriptional regulator [Oscillospiraceae bacterium]|nr:MarR family transcriptional regulator [Oscillospiraceae bacterium]
MKTQTQARLIELILTEGAMSRSEMARRLSVSASMITEATVELIDRGILRECGYKNSQGKGRRNQLLDIDISCGFALGAGLYERTLSVGLCTLKGETLSHRIINLPENPTGEYILQAGKSAATEILSDCCISPDKLFGIGLCMTRSDFERLGASDTHFGNVPVLFEPADQIISYSTTTGLPVDPNGMYVFGCGRVVRNLSDCACGAASSP